MDNPPYLPDYLTAEQRAAILHTGRPLLTLAGPGSGKTEVLTWRVVLFSADENRPGHPFQVQHQAGRIVS